MRIEGVCSLLQTCKMKRVAHSNSPADFSTNPILVNFVVHRIGAA